MKTGRIFAILATCFSMSATFFSCKNVTKPESAEKREAWTASLSDSISAYKNLIDSVETQLGSLHSQVAEKLTDFSYVSNPREVAGYYILSGWQPRYPLKKTGIIARINEDEGIEVIAALSKGSFTHVSLQSEGSEFTSRPVPHDQAFNYKTAALNTVCFTGQDADSLAMFIADHEADKIKMTFIENNTSGNYEIPSDEKQMIGTTWNLFHLQSEVKNIEKTISLYSGKINACRKILDAADSIQSK